MSFSNGYGNGFSGGGHHHGGHHGGGFFSPMMYPSGYPWYQEPSTIEIITTGDDLCVACKAGTVKGVACDKCPGLKYAGYDGDVVGVGLPLFLLAGGAFLLYVFLK